jgi:hypothetical protein
MFTTFFGVLSMLGINWTLMIIVHYNYYHYFHYHLILCLNEHIGIEP